MVDRWEKGLMPTLLFTLTPDPNSSRSKRMQEEKLLVARAPTMDRALTPDGEGLALLLGDYDY